MEAGNAVASTSTLECQSRIVEGHHVLFKLPNGEVKGLKVSQNSPISFGKVGVFDGNELIDQPYGLSYEIRDRKLHVLPPKTMDGIEETEATNELIDDGLIVQPLTAAEIEALKLSGAHASDIIKHQIENHANYTLKTEYSKEKYKKRKEAKYAKKFSTIEPTMFNVCEYWFKKDKSRIREIRCDTLSQMMNFANIRPGGKYLAVDDASGVVICSILDRLNGHGRLLTICDVDSPPAYPLLTQMNFDEDIVGSTLASLNWATAEEGYEPPLPPSSPADGVIRSERQKLRLNKRKHMQDTLSDIRQELFNGEFDGLVVASEYEPHSILERLVRYLSGSASIVVYSPTIEPLAELQAKLRVDPQYLGPTVTAGWLRRYQVLPGRTHPLMSVSGSGGYILHAIKVYDNPSALSVVAMKYQNKSQKTEVESMGVPESLGGVPSNAIK